MLSIQQFDNLGEIYVNSPFRKKQHSLDLHGIVFIETMDDEGDNAEEFSGGLTKFKNKYPALYTKFFEQKLTDADHNLIKKINFTGHTINRIIENDIGYTLETIAFKVRDIFKQTSSRKDVMVRFNLGKMDDGLLGIYIGYDT